MLGEIETDRISNALKNAQATGAQLDEVTDCSNTMQLVQRFRFVENCRVKTLFGKASQISDQKSETLYKAFDETTKGWCVLSICTQIRISYFLKNISESFYF